MSNFESELLAWVVAAGIIFALVWMGVNAI
jgi:hypothetical protein